MERIAPAPGLADEYDVLVADWEFSRLPLPAESMLDWASRVRRLSLGLLPLAEGAEPAFLYGVRSLDRRTLDMCSAFVLAEVVPVMEEASATFTFRTNVDLGASIGAFLSKRYAAVRKRPLVVVDWAGDALLFEALLPAHSRLLLLEDVEEIGQALSRPFPFGHHRHNAFHDAHAIRQGVRDYFGRLAGVPQPRRHDGREEEG